MLKVFCAINFSNIKILKIIGLISKMTSSPSPLARTIAHTTVGLQGTEGLKFVPSLYSPWIFSSFLFAISQNHFFTSAVLFCCVDNLHDNTNKRIYHNQKIFCRCLITPAAENGATGSRGQDRCEGLRWFSVLWSRKKIILWSGKQWIQPPVAQLANCAAFWISILCHESINNPHEDKLLQ